MSAPVSPVLAVPIRVAAGTTAGQAVRDAGLPGRGAPDAVVVVRDADGQLRDLSWAPHTDVEVTPVAADTEDGRSVIRHSAAHVLAQAVQGMFPDAKLGIGPPITDGFYYDFDVPEPFVPEDLEKIETRMRKIVKEGQKFSRREIDDDAARFFFVPTPKTMSVSDLEGREAKPLVHPNHEDRGTRTLTATGTIHIPEADAAPQVRLKDLGNIVIAGGSAFWSGDELDRSVPIIQWLPHDQAAPFTVLVPDGEELQEVTGFVEPAALECVGKVVQFERFGLVTIESQTRGVWLHA